MLTMSQQQLLVPYIFEFPADDALRLKERMSLLEEVGVFLSEYGENQFILREHPIGWQRRNRVWNLWDVRCAPLDQGSFYQEIPSRASHLWCPASGPSRLTIVIDDHSARQLLYQLSQCDNPYNCPHGRPVLVHFTKSDMEKMFRRIQENHTSLRELGKILILFENLSKLHQPALPNFKLCLRLAS